MPIEKPYSELHSPSFKDLLQGDKAFYNQPDYLKATQHDFESHQTLPITYTWNTEHKITRIAKQILAMIIFPIGIYQILHRLAAKLILPSSNVKLPEKHALQKRLETSLTGVWKYKRITIEVDGRKIDAMIVGKASTLNQGRWMIAANGNAQFYEDRLSSDSTFRQILSAVNSNAIVVNYPGVGSSSGLASRQALAKAYRAVLSFLEDAEKGIGAKQIIGWGLSIGAGVQGDALNQHRLDKNIKYVFIKDRTFSDLSTVAGMLTFKISKFLIKILGWDINNVESSKKLQAPKIITQSTKIDIGKYKEIANSSEIIDDGVIPAQASLAKALLEDKKCQKKNKIFVGMSEGHNDGYYDTSFIAQKIEEVFKK